MSNEIFSRKFASKIVSLLAGIRTCEIFHGVGIWVPRFCFPPFWYCMFLDITNKLAKAPAQPSQLCNPMWLFVVLFQGDRLAKRGNKELVLRLVPENSIMSVIIDYCQKVIPLFYLNPKVWIVKFSPIHHMNSLFTFYLFNENDLNIL